MFTNALLRSSDGKGLKVYYKSTSPGNTIDVSDSFSNVDFALISAWKSYDSNNDSYVVSYQKFQNGKIYYNSTLFKNGVFVSYNFSNTEDTSKNYGSCLALVYGTLK